MTRAEARDIVRREFLAWGYRADGTRPEAPDAGLALERAVDLLLRSDAASADRVDSRGTRP